MKFNLCYGCMGELDAPGAVCPNCGYDNTNDPAKQPSHVLPCGTILNGQYMVGRSLGQGGFGITYIGYDLNLEIPVCIKEYYPEGSASRSASQSRMVYWGTSENAQSMKESRRSFVKEAQKAVKLRNLAHVVTVWGVFYENETAYIIMDYIEGETLRKRLVRTQKTLGEGECVELLTPVMEDLEKAHARGIIHRDIKPDNIMLAADGEPVLLDMGAAKDLGKTAQNGRTLSSAMVVSKGFSPLEQYRESGHIGPWTDVYALCATIYYCITGKVLASPIDRMVEDSIDLNAFSPAFAAAMEKGLAIKPEDRIQSMGELIAALQAATEVRNAVSTMTSQPAAITDAEGNIYVGTLKDGQKNGSGTMTYANDDEYDRLKYEGEWKDDRREGAGKLTWTGGDKYEGEWKDDRIEGYGTYTWPSGEIYQGEWKDEKREGQGTNTWANGAVYQGEWKNDRSEGQGTYQYASGAVYQGEWKNDEFDGYGTYTWPNGAVYEGEWKNDKRDGQGTMTYTDGTKKTGTWKEDKFVALA